ncbi:SEC-C metal-binding domain-containing protein [Bosea sp. LjRoot90]
MQEKLGRNDLCVCGSGLRFQTLLHAKRPLRRFRPRRLFSETDADGHRE